MATKQNDQNPFLFSAFVKQNEGKRTSKNSGEEVRNNSTLLLVNDKDHAVSKLDFTDEEDSPKATLSDSNPFSFKNYIKTSTDSTNHFDDDSDSNSSLAEDKDLFTPHADISLPLVDDLALDVETAKENDDFAPTTTTLSDLFVITDSRLQDNGFSSDVTKCPSCSSLRRDKEKLQGDLERSKADKFKLKQELTECREKMKSVEMREADETRALEDMVQQVERNLVKATKRANAAEATVASLESRLEALQTENARLRAGGVDKVRVRAADAGRKLAGAAAQAEGQLKQLLQGVDQLRVLSESLQSIDRVTEHS